MKLKTETKEQKELVNFIDKTKEIVDRWPEWMKGNYSKLK